MRFVFTLTVPTFSGKAVQELIGEFKDAKSLAELNTLLMRGVSWILVERYFSEDSPKGQVWKPRNEVILHTAWIAMVKVFEDRA